MEVHFNSCTNATLSVHKGVLAQLLDKTHQTTPSKSPLVTADGGDPNDYVDIPLQTPDAHHTLNWDYMPDPAVADGGLVLLQVVSTGAGAVNPIERMRRKTAAVFADELSLSARRAGKS
jgi:hypothetical protein